MIFDVRTTPVGATEKPWTHSVESEGQCTWYVFYRAYQVFNYFPCYRVRETKSGAYNNAKTWLENYREPFYPHYFKDEPNIEILPGDIVVFDGNYGHVVFVEKVIDENNAFISQYNLAGPLEFSNDTWTRGTILKGNPHNTGQPLGILRFRHNSVTPVARNVEVNQIYASDPTLRVRLKPSLNGDYYCNIAVGYYNVLDKKDADGYTWYEIEKGKWCANPTTEYLPANNDVDIVREIEKWVKDIEVRINVLKDENTKLKSDMKQINEVVGKWI